MRPVAAGAALGASAPSRYDEVQAKASHNTYERDEPIFDELAFHDVRAIELDLHARRLGSPDAPGDFYVFHAAPWPGGTSCARLSECLVGLRAYDRAFPDHDVVTLFLDLKNSLDESGHGAADLDALVARELGRGRLFGPDDLLAACPGARSLRDAVRGGACAWPTLASLRGKTIVALTGGTSCAPASRLARYAARASALAFIAPGVDASCPFEAYAERREVVFLNVSVDHVAAAADARAAGLVTRIWDIDDAAAWSVARAAGASFLATDAIDEVLDPWARPGWPAAHAPIDGAIDLTAYPGAERFAPLASASDGSTDGDASLTAAIAVAGVPYADPRARACLVARDDASGAYAEVCRPESGGPVTMEVRGARGAEPFTRAADLPEARGGGIDPRSAPFVRLEVARDAEGTEVAASASLDGVEWTPIARAHVDGALPRRGAVVIAPPGGGAARALFAVSRAP